MKSLLPQSLTGQFALVVSFLAALVIAVGATTIFSLTDSTHALRQLAVERLARLQDAQDLAQQTLTIERIGLQLSRVETVAAVRETQRHIIEHVASFDDLVDRLASAPATREDVGIDAVALHRASQRFRNTVNIEAQVRETALARGADARPNPTLASLDDELRRQADALSSAAREQSDRFTREYSLAVQRLAARSDRTRAWIIGEVCVSLLLAALIVRAFLGRRIVGRLLRVSQSLRHGDTDNAQARVPVHGRDEIADMARAVEQFLEDRRQRRQAEQALKALNTELEARVAQRTSELSQALSDRMAEIAERQRAEEAARESEQFLDSIVENIPDVIFVKEAATLRFVRFNRAGELLLGSKREQLIGKSVHDLFPAEEAEFFALNDRHVLESRQMVDIPEEPVMTPRGQRFVHTVKIPILDQRGEPQFLLGISRDITEQKKAEEQLRESERRYQEVQMALAHANRVMTMGQIAASISHEIKQPIAATVTNAQAGLLWLRASPPNLDEVRQALERINKDTKHASDVMNRIHGLVKNAPPSMDKLWIDEAIGEVIELLRGEIGKSSVRLRTQFAGDLAPVTGDRVAIQQVMLNLILNAIEAMSTVNDAPKEVTVCTRKYDSSDVLISVCDSGPGLPAGDVERVFDPFYTSKATGMGMGLSICRSIVEAHGGKLWATSNAPRGAVFQFTVPSAG